MVDLAALYDNKPIRRGEGSIGGAWATGMPALNEHLKQDDSISAASARTWSLA